MNGAVPSHHPQGQTVIQDSAPTWSAFCFCRADRRTVEVSVVVLIVVGLQGLTQGAVFPDTCSLRVPSAKKPCCASKHLPAKHAFSRTATASLCLGINILEILCTKLGIVCSDGQWLSRVSGKARSFSAPVAAMCVVFFFKKKTNSIYAHRHGGKVGKKQLCASATSDGSGFGDL